MTVLQLLGALASLGSLVGVVAALVVARSQIREARRVRQIQLIDSFMRQYHSPELRLVRFRLLEGELGSPATLNIKLLPDEERLPLDQMLDLLEYMALLVRREYLDFDIFHAAFQFSPPQIWDAVSNYYERLRTAAGGRPSKTNLEWLAARYDRDTLGAHQPYMTQERWQAHTSRGRDALTGPSNPEGPRLRPNDGVATPDPGDPP